MSSEFWVLGSGFRVLGFGFRVLGFGFRVQGSGFGNGFHKFTEVRDQFIQPWLLYFNHYSDTKVFFHLEFWSLAGFNALPFNVFVSRQINVVVVHQVQVYHGR